MNINNEMIKNYLQQRSDLPEEFYTLFGSMDQERVLLFSLIDLDAELKFCQRWLILTDKRLLLIEQGQDKINCLHEYERALVKKVLEVKSLGLTTLQFLGGGNGPFFFEVQFTHRQKAMMEKMRFAIEESVFKMEMSAAETYQSTILKPILEARNNLADENQDALVRLLHYLRPYKKEVIIGMTAALCGSFISLIPAYLSGRLIDDVVRPYQSHELTGPLASKLGLTFIIGLVGAYILREFFIWQRLKRMSIIGEKVASDLRNDLFQHIQTLGADFFSRKHSGSLISRIGSDTDRIWDFIAFGVVEVTVAIGTLIGLSVVLMARDFKLGLAMVLPLPFLLFAIYWQGERMKKLFIRAWRKWSVVTSHLSDVIPGIQVVKVFGQESREVKRFTQKNKDFTEETFAFHRTWTTFWPLLMLGVHTTTILMWGLATPRLLSPAENPEHLTAGVFVSFLLYATLMVWPLEIIGQVSRMLNRALSSA
ncbi:MAG TPA: hypothetical protein DCY86_10540, partial [Bdellovibrionales bacterium]|nr:hypothetical protein [Bdellovibrionales bacterium]